MRRGLEEVKELFKKIGFFISRDEEMFFVGKKNAGFMPAWR